MINGVTVTNKQTDMTTRERGLLVRQIKYGRVGREGLNLRLIERNGEPVDTLEIQKPDSVLELPPPKNFATAYEYCDQTSENMKKIDNIMQQYVKGNASEKQVEQTMDSITSSLVDCYTQLGFDSTEITPKVIEDVHALFRLYAISAVGTESFFEGKAVANQVIDNYKGCSVGWMYYNADYYYKGEELKDKLIEFGQKIANKYGAGEVELFREYPEGDIRKGIYDSYNTIVCERARSDCGSIIDETMVPPQGMRMFYTDYIGSDKYASLMGEGDGSAESAFDGAVHIWYGDWSFSSRVPIRMDTSRFPGSVNLLDVVKGYHQPFPSEIKNFLANFDFYARIASGRYMANHSRKLT